MVPLENIPDAIIGLILSILIIAVVIRIIIQINKWIERRCEKLDKKNKE